MSTMLWDLFTGGAHYRDILLQMVDPRLSAPYLAQTAEAAVARIFRHSSCAPSAGDLALRLRDVDDHVNQTQRGRRDA